MICPSVLAKQKRKNRTIFFRMEGPTKKLTDEWRGKEYVDPDKDAPFRIPGGFVHLVLVILI